ncbi:hypothetical protein [Streptomyces liangshanensis]|uniref:hypothetical protein n=1 Tax=Streptomyces liangshanensis TaxID=2717324 RepID=UPI0036DE04ED
MVESWVIDDGGSVPVSSGTVREILRTRIAGGRFESWLTGSSGRSLAFVTNGDRALVMLLRDADDPGEHAVDPDAEGSSDGFVLSNGQRDAYGDKDTVPLGEAFRIVEHVLGTGSWPADVRREVDR